MSSETHRSHPRHPAPEVVPAHQAECPQCGRAYLARSSSACPHCGNHGIIKRGLGEFSQKVVEDNDLIKGFT